MNTYQFQAAINNLPILSTDRDNLVCRINADNGVLACP